MNKQQGLRVLVASGTYTAIDNVLSEVGAECGPEFIKLDASCALGPQRQRLQCYRTRMKPSEAASELEHRRCRFLLFHRKPQIVNAMPRTPVTAPIIVPIDAASERPPPSPLDFDVDCGEDGLA